MYEANYDTIAIIGNGFDLAHGLKTSFFDFTKNMLKEYNQRNNELMANYFYILKKYAYTEEDISVIDNWYNFECWVNKIIEGFSSAEVNPKRDLKKVYDDKNTFNTIFFDINKEMIRYLKIQDVKEKKKIENIKPYLSSKTLALNFNYTNTLEIYGVNSVFIHGSLNENEIVLGYDDINYDILFHPNYEDKKWMKSLERERLTFIRWLKSLGIEKNEFDSLMDEYTNFKELTTSSRGYEEGDYSHYDKRLKEFFDSYEEEINKELLRDIKHIVIIGHGIKSDILFLEEIFDKCDPDKIKDVTIFLHSNIGINDIKNQVEFLRQQRTLKYSIIRFEEYNRGEIDPILLDKISRSLSEY